MISHRKLPLRTGHGWKEIQPRGIRWQIAWEGAGRLHSADTGFGRIVHAGPSGAVESPLVYDPVQHRFLRYYCPSLESRDRENGLLSVDPDTGEREMHFPLHPLRTVPWLLKKIPDRPILMALVVTDTSRADRPGIVLRHQLGLFHIDEQKSLFRDLPAGCQHPVAASPETDRLLFHGPDGYQLINLRGHRKLVLSDEVWGNGRHGAAFHPTHRTLAIGGSQLALYEPGRKERKPLPTDGCTPAWSPDGGRLFFSTSSSDLHCIDPATHQREEIITIPANRHPEIKKARPVEFSPDGKFFALPMTRRAPYHADTLRSGQPSWSEKQSLLIGDLERKELWQHPGPVDYCVWIGREK